MISAADAPVSTGTIQVATFRVGDLRLGIDIRHVQEINRGLVARRAPHAPACVFGVANLRGEVVTLLDLRILLGLPGVDESSPRRAVVLRSQEESIALVVEEICDVVAVDEADLAPTPPNVCGVDARYFSAVYQTESYLLILLDVEEALRVE
jgi:purine-binding chemotaxis protein CheW